MGALLDHVRSYYAALNTGDSEKIAAHFTADAVHYYTRLGPHEGAKTIGDHTRWAVDNLDGQWHIDHAMEDGEQACIEWAMTWRDPETRQRLRRRRQGRVVFRVGKIAGVPPYFHKEESERSGRMNWSSPGG